MNRKVNISRITRETKINIDLDIDGSGKADISTGIPFFDHMLILFAVHGFFDLSIKAEGDIEVDFHHTIEDTGLVLGQAVSEAIGDRKGIARYGAGAVPMDEAFSRVNIDMSNRPYLVYNIPAIIRCRGSFDVWLAREFFRAFCVKAGMTLHINADYGENEHHIIESIFKALGRALNIACSMDTGISGVLSSKGAL